MRKKENMLSESAAFWKAINLAFFIALSIYIASTILSSGVLLLKGSAIFNEPKDGSHTNSDGQTAPAVTPSTPTTCDSEFVALGKNNRCYQYSGWSLPSHGPPTPEQVGNRIDLIEIDDFSLCSCISDRLETLPTKTVNYPSDKVPEQLGSAEIVWICGDSCRSERDITNGTF